MTFDFASYDFAADSEFDVADGDLTRLEIRKAGGAPNLHYFYDPESRSLIKSFILADSPRVRTLMNVTLIEKEGAFEPRVRLWKRSKPASTATEEQLPDIPATKSVKASVDVGEGHLAFWNLAAFTLQITGASVLQGPLRLVPTNGADLAEMLADQNKDDLLAAMKLSIGADLTQADIDLLTDRRGQLEEFRRLLEDSDYFDLAAANRRPEDVWQQFFERNRWIFGYGLSYLACEALDDAKLEQATSGANVFTGAGKRSDAVMRTKGFLSSLLFGEIKTHRTDLLASSPYRKPDVYRPSIELAGAVAQVQKTADKAVRFLQQQIYSIREETGRPTGVDVLTAKPRQVLVIGHLDQLAENGGINSEKAHSFELFRRSISDLEILTFDELYERAKFIVGPDLTA